MDYQAALERATQLYNSILRPELPAIVKRGRLEDAIREWRSVLTNCYALGVLERSSVWRNIGLSYYQLDKFVEEGQSDVAVKIRVGYLLEAVNCFHHASELGKIADRESSWFSKIHEKLEEVFVTVEGIIYQEDNLELFRSVWKTIPILYFRSRFAFNGISHFFHKAVKLAESREYLKSLNWVYICNQDLMQVLPSAHDDYRTELEDLQASLVFQECLCESSKERERADRMVRTEFFEKESPSFDALWEAVDYYKQAIIKAREIDIENEALATAQLGILFYKVFKITPKARDYLRQAIQLALSVNVNRQLQRWFVEASECLKKIQESAAKAADEEDYKAKEPYLAALKDKLEKLRSFSEAGVLLVYLYTETPPKGEAAQNINDATSMKKKLMLAVRDYHPDKNVGDMEWAVYCEEVTKTLNAFYATYK
jgi:hypothetical protein